MQEVEMTAGKLLRIFWLFTWRAFVGGFLIGAIVGFVIGFVMGATGHSQNISLVTSLAGLVVGTVWSVFAMRMALRKQYRDFRIALVAG
jgi:uncharacterized membrane protein